MIHISSFFKLWNEWVISLSYKFCHHFKSMQFYLRWEPNLYVWFDLNIFYQRPWGWIQFINFDPLFPFFFHKKQKYRYFCNIILVKLNMISVSPQIPFLCPLPHPHPIPDCRSTTIALSHNPPQAPPRAAWVTWQRKNLCCQG